MSNPSSSDEVKVKRIFRYLNGTKNKKIKYSKFGNSNLVGYSDADWGGDLSDRKSTSGYVFILAGAAISWSSKKQPIVALSSTEAEYIALCSAAQEAMFLKSLLVDLGFLNKNEAVTLYSDNQGAISIAKNNVTNNRTKHIDIKFHYIREKVLSNDIKLEYISTENCWKCNLIIVCVGNTIL
jgi:hypothetical protein